MVKSRDISLSPESRKTALQERLWETIVHEEKKILKWGKCFWMLYFLDFLCVFLILPRVLRLKKISGTFGS